MGFLLTAGSGCGRTQTDEQRRSETSRLLSLLSPTSSPASLRNFCFTSAEQSLHVLMATRIRPPPCGDTNTPPSRPPSLLGELLGRGKRQVHPGSGLRCLQGLGLKSLRSASAVQQKQVPPSRWCRIRDVGPSSMEDFDSLSGQSQVLKPRPSPLPHHA